MEREKRCLDNFSNVSGGLLTRDELKSMLDVNHFMTTTSNPFTIKFIPKLPDLTQISFPDCWLSFISFRVTVINEGIDENTEFTFASSSLPGAVNGLTGDITNDLIVTHPTGVCDRGVIISFTESVEDTFTYRVTEDHCDLALFLTRENGSRELAKFSCPLQMTCKLYIPRSITY
jgi:hypothetical protein